MAEELKPHHYWREDRITGQLVVITPDEYEQWGKDNQPSEAYRPAFARAQLPSQGGDAVEVVAYGDKQQLNALKSECSASCAVWNVPGRNREPLMTVAQHQRILAAATHPADQMADVVGVRLIELLPTICGFIDDAAYYQKEVISRIRNMTDHEDSRSVADAGQRIAMREGKIAKVEELAAELRALLAKSEGVKK